MAKKNNPKNIIRGVRVIQTVRYPVYNPLETGYTAEQHVVPRNENENRSQINSD